MKYGMNWADEEVDVDDDTTKPSETTRLNGSSGMNFDSQSPINQIEYRAKMQDELGSGEKENSMRKHKGSAANVVNREQGVCGNAAETSSRTFSHGNAWSKPKYIRINAEELGTISLDGKTVTLNKEALDQNIRKLEKALVGRIIGKKLPLNILDRELQRRWSGFGAFKTVMVESDCFICIFLSVEARDEVLMGGPWQIAGHIIGLDKWTPAFSAGSLEGLSSPVWVRFPRLPLMYWDNKTIGRIAAMVGKPLWLDAQTGEWGRSMYARVCVRLDLAKKLPAGVWIEGPDGDFFQRVQYEGISLLCFNCGIVGHRDTNCPMKKVVPGSRDSSQQVNMDRQEFGANKVKIREVQQKPNNIMDKGKARSVNDGGENCDGPVKDGSVPPRPARVYFRRNPVHMG